MDAAGLRAVGDRIERMLAELHDTAPPTVYRRVEDLLRLVTDLYGAGLEQIVGLLGDGDVDPALLAALHDDDLIASLLVVHGLHPVSVLARVEDGLDRVRPLLAQHGGDVELLDLDESAGAVRLRLLGNCDGCPSSEVTLRMAVETAITAAAPEIETIDVEPSQTSQTSQTAPAPPVPTLEGSLAPVAFVRKPAYLECPTTSEVIGP